MGDLIPWLLVGAFIWYLVSQRRQKRQSSQPSAPNSITGNTLQTQVAGVSFNNADGTSRQRIIRKGVREGDTLQLRREPSNPHDRNAIAVWCRAGQIGYLPADIARRLKDADSLSATVTDFDESDQDDDVLGVGIEVRWR